MRFLTCFALKERFSGSLVVLSWSTVIFVVILAGTLQDPAVRRRVRVVLAALAAEITAALVATKFCAAFEFCELGFFVNFFVVVVVLPLLIDLFVSFDCFAL